MTLDALDPGPNGDYPYLPRLADGTLDPKRMPTTAHLNRSPDGRVTLIDPTHTTPDGRRVNQIPAPN